MVNRDTRRALALAGSRAHRPARIVIRRSVLPDEDTEAGERADVQTETADVETAGRVDDLDAGTADDLDAGTRGTGPGSRRRLAGPGRRRAGRRRPPGARLDRGRLVRWVSLVVLAVALVIIAVQGRQWYELRALESARGQALAAARQVTIDFVTISAGSVDRDLQRVADGATGDFKDQFTKSMPQVRAAVIENKVDSQGTVLRAAVVSADRTSAVVLVAVDATVHNVNAPDGRLTHYRIRTNLARVGGAWLVSTLEFVG